MRQGPGVVTRNAGIGSAKMGMGRILINMTKKESASKVMVGRISTAWPGVFSMLNSSYCRYHHFWKDQVSPYL